MKNILKINLYIFIVSFLIHLIWEFLHSPLYTCFDLPLNQFIPLILGATFMDGILMLGFYWIGYFKNKNVKWFFNFKKSDYYLIIILGVLAASLIEFVSLNSSIGWRYTELMPIVPIINVGLTPILQLIILPFVIFWIVKKIINR